AKAWGLSALRIGFAISSPDLADQIARQSVKFNVNSVAVSLAQRCLDSPSYRRHDIDTVHGGLDAIQRAIGTLPQYELISNSSMNIFCIRHRAKSNLHSILSDLNINTKSLDKMPGMIDQGFCRVLIP